MTDSITEMLFALLTILTFTSIHTAPVQHISMTTGYAHRYLKQYGYLTGTNPTGNDIAEAMKSMQQFFGLSETGELDPDSMDMMSLPRCGIMDVHPEITPANCTSGGDDTSCRQRRYTYLGRGPWDSSTLTYRFNNYTPDLRKNQVESAIERALGVWAAVTPLTFVRKQDGDASESASDIEIRFGRGYHGINHPSDESFDGPSYLGGTVLAHAFNPGSVFYPSIGGDMHFDEDERWQDGAGIDLFTVAAHEFGHSLGLGHSNVRGALMYPTYYGYDPNFRLHEDDIKGIQSLYGARPSTESPTTTKAPTPRVPETSSTNTPAVTQTSKPSTTTSKIAETSTPVTATVTPSIGVDYCDTSFDTIATLYNVFFDVYTVAIKDQKYLRFAAKDTILPEAHLNVEQSAFFAIWRDSQDPLSVLLEKEDGSLVVIRDNLYWEYDLSAISIKLKPQFPRPVTSLGLPENINITAALHDRKERKVFLFTNTRYWSFDGNLNTVDLNSPKTIAETWPGVPNNFNAAFSWRGNSCFVKDTQYWCFNERTSQVGPEFSRSFAEDFLGCKPEMPRSSGISFITHGTGSLTISLYCFVVILLSKHYIL